VSIAFKLKFSTQNASLYSFSKSQICFPAFFNDSAEKRRSDKYKNEFYKLTATLKNARLMRTALQIYNKSKALSRNVKFSTSFVFAVLKCFKIEFSRKGKSL